jgi:hypothetical protein
MKMGILLRLAAGGLGITAMAGIATLVAACSSASPAASTTPATTLPSEAAAQPTATTPGEPGNPPGGFGRGQGVLGTIAAINGNILTLTTMQGQKVNVTMSMTTTIDKTVRADLTDLKTGEFLTIAGSADSSGAITATSIMARPQAQNMTFPTPSPGADFTPGGQGQPGPGGNAGALDQPGNPGGPNQSGGPSGNPGDSGNGMFSRTIGTLVSVNGNTLVVTVMQGSQVTVSVNDQTVIEQTVTGTAADLHAGQFLTVIGPAADNGDVSAESISIRSVNLTFPTTFAPQGQ